MEDLLRKIVGLIFLATTVLCGVALVVVMLNYDKVNPGAPIQAEAEVVDVEAEEAEEFEEDEEFEEAEELEESEEIEEAEEMTTAEEEEIEEHTEEDEEEDEDE